MYAGEAITRNVKFVDNVLPSSADGISRRARHQQFLQEGSDDLWLRRNWPWSYKETPAFAVTAASQKALLPADYLEVGRDGGVYIAGTQLQSHLEETTPREIQFMRRSGRTESPPTRFAIWDSDNNGRVYLQMANGGDATLYLYHRKRPLLIVDRPLYPTAAATVTAGLLTGTYNWAVSFVTENGESELGYLSNQVTVTLFQVLLTNIPTSPLPGVTARRIYRNANGSSVMKLEEEITDNTTTQLTTNIADGALGAVHPSGVTIYTGLEVWPEPYVFRVLIPYMRYRAMEDKGDVRGEPWKKKYEEGVGWAAKTETQAKSTLQIVAGYGLSHMH